MSGPMYLQIAEDMRNNGATGTFRPEQTPLPQRELMQQFTVLRVTVHRALKERINESLLESRHGSDYVVRFSSHLSQTLERVTSFSEECLLRGLTSGSVLISSKYGKSNSEQKTHFGVPPGFNVLRMKRVLTGNSVPLQVEHATLLESRASDWRWPEGRLYLEMKRCDLNPVRVHQQCSLTQGWSGGWMYPSAWP